MEKYPIYPGKEAVEYAKQLDHQTTADAEPDGYNLGALKSDLDLVSLSKSKDAAEEMVKCDCGHYVEKIHVLYASLGSACEDCYDRMS